MGTNRRQFLWACTGLAASTIAHGEETAFTLQFSSETLERTGALGLAVAASASCSCEAAVVDADGRGILVGKWDLEPKAAKSKFAGSSAASGELKAVGARLDVYPQGGKRPHLAGVIQTGGDAEGSMGARPHLTGFIRSRESDRERLEKTAEKLFFLKDPAPRPDEGHFTVDLRAESNLLLKVWQGDSRTGPVVFAHGYRNLPAGENPIPWNLRDRRGALVGAGEYLATLVATPTSTGRSDTLFFASFQVI
jgi:hypothetical protein